MQVPLHVMVVKTRTNIGRGRLHIETPTYTTAAHPAGWRRLIGRDGDGSSGGMETAAAEQLWERSIDKFGFRYTTLLSEGDAKTYNQLCRCTATLRLRKKNV